MDPKIEWCALLGHPHLTLALTLILHGLTTNSFNRSPKQPVTKVGTQRSTRSCSHVICLRCKDPADPMQRVSRKGRLSWVLGGKRFEC